jgi:hypothetical protein
MMVSVHVATGAAAGAIAGSRLRAALLGAALHAVEDAIPHEDFHSRRFEIWSGVSLLALIAAARGPFDPAVVGAAACAAPDLEHVLRLPLPGGRKLFPSHRYEGWHREDGLSVRTQLLAAGVIVALVVLRGKER